MLNGISYMINFFAELFFDMFIASIMLSGIIVSIAIFIFLPIILLNVCEMLLKRIK